MRSNKIAPLQHTCLTSLSTCAKGVQFYCPSHTYPAIPYCTIFAFLTHCSVSILVLFSPIFLPTVATFKICPWILRIVTVTCRHFLIRGRLLILNGSHIIIYIENYWKKPSWSDFLKKEIDFTNFFPSFSLKIKLTVISLYSTKSKTKTADIWSLVLWPFQCLTLLPQGELLIYII